MRWALALTALAFASSSLSAVPAQSKSTRAKPAAKKSVHSRTRRSKVRRAPAPSYQLQPAPDRYQEIQKALADRGYFKGEVNGQWGRDSVDALQRYQTDQKIPNDGKINSLSLIGLGLGPKHDAAAASQSAVQAPSESSFTPPMD